MVFKAALASDDLWVFAPGENEGGDIVLNTNSSLMMDLTPGRQGYFEIVRAIGTVLGLSTTAELGRDQTVLGARVGVDLDSLPFASAPLPMDISCRSRPPGQPASLWCWQKMLLSRG